MNIESIRKQLDRLNEREFGINMADFLTQSDKEALHIIENERADIKKKIQNRLETLNRKESSVLFNGVHLSADDHVELNRIHDEQKELKELLKK